MDGLQNLPMKGFMKISKVTGYYNKKEVLDGEDNDPISPWNDEDITSISSV
jgi:hypothetical protein